MADLDAHTSKDKLTLRFDGADFHLFKKQFIVYARMKKCAEALQGPLPVIAAGDSEAVKEAKQKMIDMQDKLWFALSQCLSKDIQNSLIDIEGGDAYGLWQAILAKYESNTEANKQALRAELNACMMKEGEDFDTFKGNVLRIYGSLRSLGEVIEHKTLLSTLLTGLPQSYRGIKQTLNIVGKNMTIDEVCQHIRENDTQDTIMIKKEEEQQAAAAAYAGNGGGWRGGRGGPPQAYGRGGSRGGGNMQHMQRGGGPTCWTCNKPGHRAYDCSQNENEIKCGNCRSIGHADKDCYSRGRGGGYMPGRGGRGNSGSGYHATESEDKKDQGAGYAAALNAFSSLGTKQDDVLDSGATSHFVNDLELLTNVKDIAPVRVSVANNQEVFARKSGTYTIKVARADGSHGHIKLKNALYVPGFSVNLLSASKLVEAGIRVTLDEPDALLTDKKTGEVLLKIPKRGMLFVHTREKVAMHTPRADGRQSSYATVVTNGVAAKQSMWHQRLGHMGQGAMKMLFESQAADGLADLQKIRDDGCQCEACVLGKSHRKPFGRTSSNQPTAIQECVVADIMGPINVKDEAGRDMLTRSRYLLTLIDVYSRRMWGYALENKSDAAAVIIDWHKAIVVESGKPLKEFHTDGGGEFMSSVLQRYWADVGTLATWTTRGTPQHNAIAERAYRTLCNSARAMLLHARLPAKFWIYAMMHAIWLRNRCLTTATHDQKTPYEIWTGKRADLKHARVFGCKAYVNLMKDQLIGRKFEARAKMGIYVGYDYARLAHKVYIPDRKSVIFSRDVTFFENEFSGDVHSRDPKEEFVLPCDVLGEGELDDEEEDEGDNPRRAAADAHKPDYTKHDAEERKERGRGPHVDSDSEGPSDDDLGDEADNSEHEPVVKVEDEEEEEKVEQMKPKARHMPPALANWQQQRTMENKEKKATEASTIHKPVATTRRTTEKHVVAKAPQGHMPERPKRDPKPFSRYGLVDSRDLEKKPRRETANAAMEYALAALNDDPKSYEDAMSRPDADLWMAAMQEELTALAANGTWELTDVTLLPQTQRVNIVGSKWVFTKKLKSDGSVERYKARMVAKGYDQRKGIDFNETFAPTLRSDTLNMMLALATILDYEIEHIDVSNAFLNGTLKETVLMQQPPGFENGGGNMVCRLIKSLYGTKQAGNEWNGELNEFVTTKMGFTRCGSDSCLYVKMSKTGVPILAGVFVDDVIPVYVLQDKEEWMTLKAMFMKKYKCRDLGEATWVTGLKIERNRKERTMKISQPLFIAKMLEEFGMRDCHATHTPAEQYTLSNADNASTIEEENEGDRGKYMAMVGSLLWVTKTRPDIAHAVGVLTRFMQNPGPAHMTAAKRVMRYLKGTNNMGLNYSGYDSEGRITKEVQVSAYADASWAGDLDDRKSTTGFYVKINDCVISYASKKQKTQALSSAEAEYIAISATLQEIIWINQLLEEIKMTKTQTSTLHFKKTGTAQVLTDSQSAIAIAEADRFHARTKHIELRHHFVRDAIKNKTIKLEWVPTGEQVADVLTKSLGPVLFKKMRNMLMRENKN